MSGINAFILKIIPTKCIVKMNNLQNKEGFFFSLWDYVTSAEIFQIAKKKEKKKKTTRSPFIVIFT